MSAIVSTCRVPSCRAKIARGRLMCLTHWRMVPKIIQRRVFATLSVYRERGTDAARAQYSHAVDDAIHAVRVAQDKRKAASA